MNRVRILDLVKPFMAFIPEIEYSTNKVSLQDKIAYTVGIGFLYFLLCGTPLYGVNLKTDPFLSTRSINASSFNSPLELGVTPIVTAGLIFQIFGGMQLINVNYDLKSDRQLFQTAQKLFAVIIAGFHSLLLILSGYFGDITYSSALLIGLQIFFAELLLILLDEIIEKGYAFGSGYGFFILLSLAQSFVWNVFSFTKESNQFVGSIPALLCGIWQNGLSDYCYIVTNAFFRENFYNLRQTYIVVITFLIFAYIINFRIDIPVRSSRIRSISSTFPIKLFYTGAMPIFMLSTLTQNFLLYSLFLYTNFPKQNFVKILGIWKDSQPSSGIAFYISPNKFTLLKIVFYLCYYIILCTCFSIYWTKFSGNAPHDVAKQFQQQSIVILGQRQHLVVRELSKIIPLASALGGALLGFIVALGDILGSNGQTASIIMAFCTIMNYFEILAQDGRLTNMNKMFGI